MKFRRRLAGSAVCLAMALCLWLGGIVTAEKQPTDALLTDTLLQENLLANESEQTDGVAAFTLQMAIEFALETSPAIKLAQIDYAEAEMAWQMAQANHLLSGSQLELKQAELQFRKAANQYALAKQDVAQVVEEAFYSVLRAEAALRSAEDALARAKKQDEIVQRKFDSGIAPELDLIEARNNLTARQAELAQAISDLEISRMRFNRALGRPLLAPVSLVQEDTTYDEVAIGLEEAIEYALTNRFELIAGAAEVKLREEEVVLKDNDYTPEMEKRRIRYALERAKLNQKDLEMQIQLSVRESYSQLIRAQSQIALLQGKVELAARRLEIAEVRYNAGLSTIVELIDAQNALSDAEAQATAAIYDYNLAKANFYRSIGKLTYEIISE